MHLSGVWLPIVTPFLNGTIDFSSYHTLIDHYTKEGVSGLIPLGTTGEIPTITEYEFETIIDKTLEYNRDRLPVYIGVGGNDTAHVLSKLRVANKYHIEGILSVCPYYNKPSQQGIYHHFHAISEATDRNIILYNIPYRTGVNMQNETIFRLAEIPNIVALKDSCGDIKQTLSLLKNRPENFSILTGEDILFFVTLALGGDGGILASSHVNTSKFVNLFQAMEQGSLKEARSLWNVLYPMIPLLFQEPNPSPVKYCLKELGLLSSDEVRLPLLPVTSSLAGELNIILNSLHKTID